MASKEMLAVAHDFIEQSHGTIRYRFVFDGSSGAVRVDERGFDPIEDDTDGISYGVEEWLGAIAFTNSVATSDDEIVELAGAFTEAILDRSNALGSQ